MRSVYPNKQKGRAGLIPTGKNFTKGMSMIDSENLSKLLGHLPPAKFRDLVTGEFGMLMPVLDPKQGKREQRAAMAAALSAIPVASRQKMEDLAERIVLLADGPGQDVIEGLADDIAGDDGKKEFGEIRNQFERALWLHIHEPKIFKEALDARQADVFRQSESCYSGFVAPLHLAVKVDAASRTDFHQRVAKHLGCAIEAVAIQVFKRLRPDTDTGEEVDLYQISVHHNRPPETIDCVQDSELVPQEVVRADSTHATYEPANGHLEVLSRDTGGREVLAAIVAECLLHSPLGTEKIVVKQYDYQSLAALRNFDLTGENVESVKVIELGYGSGNHRTALVKIWANDAQDIYAAARSLLVPTFDFTSKHLNYAKLSIRVKRVGVERARTITIVLRENNRCNIKTKRERDRAMCDRLLTKWHLLMVIGDAPAIPVHYKAA
jgi:hypothetical protein